MKPQLAKDATLDDVIYPCWLQPKIDGVRALNLTGQLTGRSLDPFEGFGITDYFSLPFYSGLDGEMTLGSNPASTDRLCSLTTGAMGRFVGVTEMADLHWWLFDCVDDQSVNLPYEKRYFRLLMWAQECLDPRIHIIPYEVCNNRAELDAGIARLFEANYEGAIIRNPRAVHKEGRPTQEHQELWRVKPWGDFEILVTGITEGRKNQNEKKTNTLGHSERSSAKAGQTPNGQVGSIQGTMVADFHNPITGKLLFAKGLPVTCGSGKLSVKEATHLFQNPHEIVSHYVKVKTMTHGVKDLPRMATYLSHRLRQDMS